MRNILRALLALPLALAPVFAGGMHLEIGDAKGNRLAAARSGVVVARLTACHTPAEALLTATAEGLVAGKRQTIALKPDALAEPGLWSIARAWPAEGKWVLRLVVTHPQYGSYTSGVVVALNGDSFDPTKVRRFDGNPATSTDIAEILSK